MSLQAQEQAQARKAQIYDLREYRGLKQYLEANVRAFVRHGDPLRRDAVYALFNAVLSNHNRKRMSFRSFDVLHTDGGEWDA